MKRPNKNRQANRDGRAQSAPPADAAQSEKGSNMAVADPEKEAPNAEGAEEKKDVRPKIQTTVRPEDAEAFKAYCAQHSLTPNVALRKILADALGYELPASEYTAVTRHKYSTPEEAKAAAKERDKERRDEMAEALAFFRKMRAEGKA